MPNFNVYITDDERIDLFDFIKSKQGSFVIEKDYDKPKYETLEDSSALIENIDQLIGRYFIISPKFQIEPLDLIEFNNGTKYYISQKYGGPYLDLFFTSGYPDEANVPYKMTSLYCYPKFYHSSSVGNGEFKATPEIILFYNQIILYIKAMYKCKRLKINGYNYWISEKVMEGLNLI